MNKTSKHLLLILILSVVGGHATAQLNTLPPELQGIGVTERLGDMLDLTLMLTN
jgi:hypothetical protein